MSKRKVAILIALMSAAAQLGACPAPQQPTTVQPTVVQQPPPRVVRLQENPTGTVSNAQPVAARNPELDTDAYRQRAQQAAETLNYNADSNFGGSELTSGFSPDPWEFPLTAGGGSDFIDVATLGLIDDFSSEPCGRAYVTRKPDFHFTFEAGQYELVRFYVITENGADATLLINDPQGRWRCNDDHPEIEGWGNERMPSIDFNSPVTGRYDIWVGTYDQSAHNPANLYVTEVDANHP
jgi:hypothetical protein